MPLLLHVVPACPPARFARLAAALGDAVQAPGAPPRLLFAELAGPEVALLGRHQRRATAVPSGPCARRTGGGRTVVAGDGVVGMILARHDFEVPPDRVLNRAVRALDRGLARCLGAPVNYFGRDHVVARGAQLAVLSQEERIVEVLIGVRRPLGFPPGQSGYPEHRDPRISGLQSTTLGDVRTEVLVNAIGAAYAAALDLELEPAPLPSLFGADGPELVVDEDEEGWQSSGVADVPIGFVEALVRCVGDRIAAVRIRGDFIAPVALVRAIEARLAHSPIDVEELTRRVGDAYARTPGAFIHGVVNLGIFAEAVAAAAGAATLGPDGPGDDT